MNPTIKEIHLQCLRFMSVDRHGKSGRDTGFEQIFRQELTLGLIFFFHQGCFFLPEYLHDTSRVPGLGFCPIVFSDLQILCRFLFREIAVCEIGDYM